MAAIGRWVGSGVHSRGGLALTLALALAFVVAPAASARVADDAMPPVKQCADTVDNDGDGHVDYPADPDCGSVNDNSEAGDPVELAACEDLADNDGDGKVDLADPGCSGSSDDDETDPPPPPPPPLCSDGQDNDGDGKVDYPADPGCSGTSDNNETDPVLPQCSDGQDNDGDGKVDYPADPGCSGTSDNNETNPPPPPPPAACDDDNDNDGDGKVDLADPGCSGSSDNDETDPPPPPPPPPPPALCADGKDNDDDGKVDMADPGCTAASDNDETNAPSSGGSGGSTSTTAQPAPTIEVLGTQVSEPGTAAAGLVVSPFPVVRIRGRVTRRGMRVTLFRVTAPRGSTVIVRCRGRGCVERRTTLNVSGSSLRLVSLERGFRAGAIIEVAVTQGDLIGKYTRFRARAGRAPARLDGCARPGSIRRVTCPGGRAG